MMSPRTTLGENQSVQDQSGLDLTTL
jgi:hypothetical protein